MTDNVSDEQDSDRSSDDDRESSEGAPRTRAPSWAEVVEAINACFMVSGSWHRLADRLHSLLRENGIDDNDHQIVPLRRALNFFLDAHGGPQADVALKAFGLVEGRRWTVGSVPQDDIDTWRRIADDVDHPAAKAHFNDLLFSRGGPLAMTNAVRATEAYLEVARINVYTASVGDEDHQFDWQSHSRNLALGRALSLRHVVSRNPATPDLVGRVQDFAVERMNALIRQPDPSIGDLMLIARLLVRSRRTLSTSQRAAVEAGLDRALVRFARHSDVVESLAEQLTLLDSSRRTELNRLRVQVRIDEAQAQTQGQIKMIHLEQAASLARDLHFEDLRAEATRAMQRINHDDLGFQTFSAESALQVELVAAAIRRASEGSSWRDALDAWLSTGAPSGSAAENRRTVDEMRQHSLVSQLGFATVIYGRDGLPRWTAATEEERREHELARHEMFHIQFNGMVLARALDAIAAKHGVPSVEELALHLSRGGDGDADLARAMAHALRRYWLGDHEGALITAALRIEAGARTLALSLDEAAYVTSRRGSPGVYLGIAALVELLESHGLDEDWSRFLLTEFVSPAGRTLRHDLAHGFDLDQIEHRLEAALALRALGVFVYASWRPADEAFRAAPPTPSLFSPGLVDATILLVNRVRQGASLRRVMSSELRSMWRVVRRR